MNLSKFRAGRAEFAFCLLGPVVVFLAIMVPGRIHCRNVRQDLREREACLAQAPRMEQQLAEARKMLERFAPATGAADKAAELTLAADNAAAAYGFAARSVDVQKQPAGTEPWADFKVLVHGTGTLQSVVGMLDFLEQPVRPFRVSRINMAAKGFYPEPIYDASVDLRCRIVEAPLQTGAVIPARPVTAAQAAQQTARLGQVVETVRAWADVQHKALVAPPAPSGEAAAPARVQASVPADVAESAGPAAVSEPAAPAAVFVLRGVIQNRAKPLALTDRGVFGVGDKVDGAEILSIGGDYVTVRDQRGRLEKIRLYSADAP